MSGAKLKDVEFRAYDGRQYSETHTLQLTVENRQEGGSNGFIPGFEIAGLMGSMGAAIVLSMLRKKRE